jgi:hypothetical protein
MLFFFSLFNIEVPMQVMSIKDWLVSRCTAHLQKNSPCFHLFLETVRAIIVFMTSLKYWKLRSWNKTLALINALHVLPAATYVSFCQNGVQYMYVMSYLKYITWYQTTCVYTVHLWLPVIHVASWQGYRAQLVELQTFMQKVVSSNHARPYIKFAHSTGPLTALVSLVVISVQLQG